MERRLCVQTQEATTHITHLMRSAHTNNRVGPHVTNGVRSPARGITIKLLYSGSLELTLQYFYSKRLRWNQSALTKHIFKWRLDETGCLGRFGWTWSPKRWLQLQTLAEDQLAVFFPDFQDRLNYDRIHNLVSSFLVPNFMKHFNHFWSFPELSFSPVGKILKSRRI